MTEVNLNLQKPINTIGYILLGFLFGFGFTAGAVLAKCISVALGLPA